MILCRGKRYKHEPQDDGQKRGAYHGYCFLQETVLYERGNN